MKKIGVVGLVVVIAMAMTAMATGAAAVAPLAEQYADEVAAYNTLARGDAFLKWLVGGERVNCLIYMDGGGTKTQTRGVNNGEVNPYVAKREEMKVIGLVFSGRGELIELKEGYVANPTIYATTTEHTLREIVASGDVFAASCTAVKTNWIRLRGTTLMAKIKVVMVERIAWMYG